MIKDSVYHKAVTDLTDLEIIYCTQLKKQPGNDKLKETVLKIGGVTSALMGSYYTANRYLEAAKERDHTINRLHHEIDGMELKISMLEEVNAKLLKRIEEITAEHEA